MQWRLDFPGSSDESQISFCTRGIAWAVYVVLAALNSLSTALLFKINLHFQNI